MTLMSSPRSLFLSRTRTLVENSLWLFEFSLLGRARNAFRASIFSTSPASRAKLIIVQ